ncbi:hypothetical protein PRIPAC_75175 [Pristionchus pacificus]|uniref:Na/H antiporter n=1 Tax=Pristionchus pacificus TaxID=54126 RepID=A0A2A6CR29_PRIPA|nr:hypothetical protein PRIPAC_75175 [Pristionchus pacificus]|eukprot:PDM80589.1 Na/H antiporter [Pristionchus pacificus]
MQNSSADDVSIPFISFNFHFYGNHFDLLSGIGWLLLATLAKAVFARWPRAAVVMPSSTMLVLIGLAIGLLMWRHRKYLYGSTVIDSQIFDRPYREYQMDSETFFVFLLAPIIFDAGYFMPNRAFFASIITILVFAVGLTIWNTVAIGLSLSVHSSFIPSIALVPLLLFSSLLSASDPVAIIAVFDEIQVNDFLFVHVFGEALFNDAIAVVRKKTIDHLETPLLQIYSKIIQEEQEGKVQNQDNLR